MAAFIGDTGVGFQLSDEETLVLRQLMKRVGVPGYVIERFCGEGDRITGEESEMIAHRVTTFLQDIDKAGYAYEAYHFAKDLRIKVEGDLRFKMNQFLLFCESQSETGFKVF